MSKWDEMTAAPGTTKTAAQKASTSVEKTVVPQPIKQDKASAEVVFSDDKIQQWLFGNMEKSSSNVCAAFYGFDGTAKSGIALDCRSQKEREEGYKVIVFDLDGGCAPLKVIYHNNDPNIVIKNPLVRDALKNIDYEMTFGKLKASLDYIERNIETLKIKAIVFDGIDRFLKICEYSMREEIGKDITEGVNYLYWKMRNQKYNDVMEQIKLMDVDRYFITHIKKDDQGESFPDWEKKTSDIVFQKVRCFRESSVENGDKIVYLKAEIEKCKTNLLLEGKVYTVSETIQHADGTSTARWYGLNFGRDNQITQKSTE
jgi:hypothetical protein